MVAAGAESGPGQQFASVGLAGQSLIEIKNTSIEKQIT
jgi:hypothetical protein